MLRYRQRLVKDTNGSILVDVPAVPEAHTFGEDRGEALRQAPDAIETAFIGYMENRRPIPSADYAGHGQFVTLPALAEAKIALYEAMRTAGVGKAELVKRLDYRISQVNRLLGLHSASRLDQLESAFRALGKMLSVEIHEAA